MAEADRLKRESVGPINCSFHEAYDGSVRVNIEFSDGNRQIAELFMLEMNAAKVAAGGVVEGLLSPPNTETELKYEVLDAFDVDYDATLTVHNANGPGNWRYKVVKYPPDVGRWALARIYVFSTAKVGPCPMEGRVRSVSLAKSLADAMARHWRK